MATDGSMPSKESGCAFQKRVAAALKEAGYSIKGCQLVFSDFKVLHLLLSTGQPREGIQDYLERCRRTALRPGHLLEGGHNHALVLDGKTVIAISRNKMGARIARRDYRLYGRLCFPCRSGCGMM